ncbi:hypothetical protein PybrP1_008136 [[Pythium] brassicae (nom. inval.)]|nr:hypothetical protein PybrP1_008136 [[Pythium] brassicae (nom. inval.)]
MTYNPEKYQQRREAVLAAEKCYYEKNKEARKSKQREYDHEHREKIIQRIKEYRACGGESAFYNKLSNVLISQDKAFKFNIRLHYTLIDRITKKEFDIFATERTKIYDTPIAINSKRDISKTINHIKSLNKSDKLPYPSSSAQLKAIAGFKIVIYRRQHELGENIEIPKPFDELEECFKMNIDVFELSENESITKIRESSTRYGDTINILD